MGDLTKKGKAKTVEQEKKMAAKELMKNPCFVIAHELFDALPIHQFHYNAKRQWCEKVVQLNKETQ